MSAPCVVHQTRLSSSVLDRDSEQHSIQSYALDGAVVLDLNRPTPINYLSFSPGGARALIRMLEASLGDVAAPR